MEISVWINLIYRVLIRNHTLQYWRVLSWKAKTGNLFGLYWFVKLKWDWISLKKLLCRRLLDCCYKPLFLQKWIPSTNSVQHFGITAELPNYWTVIIDDVRFSTCRLTGFFGCCNTWSIWSRQNSYKGVFFPKAECWVAELFVLSLTIWNIL